MRVVDASYPLFLLVAELSQQLVARPVVCQYVDNARSIRTRLAVHAEDFDVRNAKILPGFFFCSCAYTAAARADFEDFQDRLARISRIKEPAQAGVCQRRSPKPHAERQFRRDGGHQASPRTAACILAGYGRASEASIHAEKRSAPGLLGTIQLDLETDH